MVGPSGRFSIAFNGEIYNHKALAEELRGIGYHFRGHSDTEILVSAFEAWGVRETLPKLVGMFAFAAWDNQDRVLYLARDRLGEKPLYYGRVPGAIVFGSELKALRVHPRWGADRISREALHLYLRYGYVPAPYSIYENVFKLMPGSLLAIPAGERLEADTFSATPGRKAAVEPELYWDITAIARERGVGRVRRPDGEAIQALDQALRTATRDQMIADVPLGGFLSGGIDSSTVVAIMQAVSPRPVNTFTIGFEEKEFNEAEHAKAIARHLGTHHHELYVTSRMALDVIPDLAAIYDEPFADSSQVPTLLLSQMAKRKVTVCLSGDAGDELFCGYNRYIYTDDIVERFLNKPVVLRRMLAGLIERVPPQAIYRALQAIAGLYPKLRSLNNANIQARVRKLVDCLEAETLVQLYRGLVSYWSQPDAVMRHRASPATEYLSDATLLKEYDSAIDQLMYWDLRTYLPDDNLVKVDRAAMHHSLETRLPLLDHRVVEMALSLPVDQKLRGGATKWVLRQVLYQYVPKELIERPKMGFSVPIAGWLRGELREWAEELLSPGRLQAEGFFKPEVVRRSWDDHLSGRADNAMRLWTILNFQSWLQSIKSSEGAERFAAQVG